MSEKANSKPDANYTPEMVAILTDAAPLNLEKARALETVLNRSYRSIIAKAKSLELPYEVKKPVPKRVGVITKAELVLDIERTVDGAEGILTGLEKAPASALVNLLALMR